MFKVGKEVNISYVLRAQNHSGMAVDKRTIVLTGSEAKKYRV